MAIFDPYPFGKNGIRMKSVSVWPWDPRIRIKPGYARARRGESRPNGQKTDMFRASEQHMDARNGIFGQFAVQHTMPDMFVWLEQRSDSITSNFAVREY